MYLSNGSFLQGSKYRINRHISSGGFGNTYEAELCMIQKRVAIKEFFVKNFCNRDSESSQVSASTSSNQQLVNKLKQKFIDEAASIWQFNHPNIVRVTDVFEENGTAYYVMDYINGISLHSMLKRDGALCEEKAIRYIKQVADALQYVHSQNRLHLDIKPGNIMVDANDNAILIDFGASKQYDEQGENTSTLLGLNTIGYAPVEQMSRSFSDFNPSADVYALGATLYKLLTNITPKDSVLLMTGDEELSPLPSSISQTVRNAVEKAMIPQRKKRTQTIPDFLKSLINIEPNRNDCKNDNVESLNDEITIVENIETTNVSEYIDDSVISIDVLGTAIKMIKVEGGSFQMGSNSFNSNADESPIHKVSLDSFYMGKTVVTQELWEKVMKENPSYFTDDVKLPVERVSWNDCQKFLQKINAITGRLFRLPTEAEWEFAARGGIMGKGYRFSGSNDINEVAWIKDNSYTKESWLWGQSGHKTRNVALKKPNELGIYDMSGNVWEWCQDRYNNYPKEDQKNPLNNNGDFERVLRGGSWEYNAEDCSVSRRFFFHPDNSKYDFGLRLALSC